MNSFADRTILLTGASRGIGRALALEFARAGTHLVLNARKASLLADVAAACGQSGVKVAHVTGDISQSETARRMVEEALAIGGLYGFVHNAGVAGPGPYLWELPKENFDEVLGASLVAAYQLVRHVVPELRRQGFGIAVFFGSAAADVALPGLAAYCVAKAAEEHLARQLAAEVPEVTSFAYRPGIVDTDMQAQARHARGGAAHLLRPEFQGYKERGELISPEAAAKALVRIMTRNPRRFHGGIATWRDAR